MRWVSEGDKVRVPRKLRICSFERLIMPWRLPVWPVLILPFAVKRKRFLAPDLVFSLGISRLLLRLKAPFAKKNRHGMPFRRAVRIRGAGLYARRKDLQAGSFAARGAPH